MEREGERRGVQGGRERERGEEYEEGGRGREERSARRVREGKQREDKEAERRERTDQETQVQSSCFQCNFGSSSLTLPLLFHLHTLHTVTLEMLEEIS